MTVSCTGVLATMESYLVSFAAFSGESNETLHLYLKVPILCLCCALCVMTCHCSHFNMYIMCVLFVHVFRIVFHVLTVMIALAPSTSPAFKRA